MGGQAEDSISGLPMENLANQITISMPANPAFVPIVRNLAPNEAATVEVTDLYLAIYGQKIRIRHITGALE
jgi:hypothetical protein